MMQQQAYEGNVKFVLKAKLNFPHNPNTRHAAHNTLHYSHNKHLHVIQYIQSLEAYDTIRVIREYLPRINAMQCLPCTYRVRAWISYNFGDFGNILNPWCTIRGRPNSKTNTEKTNDCGIVWAYSSRRKVGRRRFVNWEDTQILRIRSIRRTAFSRRRKSLPAQNSFMQSLGVGVSVCVCVVLAKMRNRRNGQKSKVNGFTGVVLHTKR